MKITTHERRVLKILLKISEGTSTDAIFIAVANVNQYFCSLVKKGIVKNRWGMKGNARVKYRSIADMKKAMDYLAGKSA